MLQSIVEPSEGDIKVPEDIVFGYVPQVIESFYSLSGGQRFNKALSEALALDPNVLLLDEPTNHLDLNNRRSLMRLLRNYSGTLIVVSHDVELLRNDIDTLWDIDKGRVRIFSGSYDDYYRERKAKRASIEYELAKLDRQKKDNHQALMKEQERSKKSRLRGEKKRSQGYWPTLVAGVKERQAQETRGRNTSEIMDKKQGLMEKLSELRLPEIIKPKFSLIASDTGSKALLTIHEGTCGYDEPLLRHISLCVGRQDHIAIRGDNGSGKSTLLKAILNDPAVIKTGQWFVPRREDIGYLDQHYRTLGRHKTVIECVYDIVPGWSYDKMRCHLNQFLFHKNEEVNARVATLSGGEKARLSLAQIAAKTPKLLVLDEITNNLDLETREHVIQVLGDYPGAMIVISHDEDFLKAIHIGSVYDIDNKVIKMRPLSL